MRSMMPTRIKPVYSDARIVKKGADDVVLNMLRAFLDAEEPKLMLWLHRLWNSQQNAITYKELREAIENGAFNMVWLKQWQIDYTKVINTRFSPAWEKAMQAGAKASKKSPSDILYNFVQEYITQRGAQFVTNVVQEQQYAIRALLSKAVYEDLTADELAKQIRPLIGLTKRQAIANHNYYVSVFNSLYIEAGVSKKAAEKRARDASLRYAAKQHRYRAMNIARTELAMAYNKGADSSVRQAQQEGLMGTCVKRWITADDERVCSVCGALHETVIEMDESFDYKGAELYPGSKLLPPAHSNCRCSVIYEEID